MPHTMSATPSSSRATEAARRFNLLRVGALILRLMTSSFITAIVMGVLATGYEYAHVVPLIMEAEAFERRRLSEGNATSEEVEEWAPADGMERGAYTFLSNVIVSFAFSLMLVAIAAIDDVHVSMRSGLQRGAAGWTIFVALPSAGLPPELPGMAGADLTSRQLWWLYAVFFGALGFLIALLASRLPEPRRAASAEKVVTFYQLRGESLRYWIIQLTAIVLACVVAAIPHMSGAPHPSLSHEPVNTTVTCGASHEECAKAGPGPELAATYAVWCLATAFLYWLCLGVSSQTSKREPEQRPGRGDNEMGQSTLINGEGANGLRLGATRFADADHTGASKTTNRGPGGAGGTHTTLDDLRHALKLLRSAPRTEEGRACLDLCESALRAQEEAVALVPQLIEQEREASAAAKQHAKQLAAELAACCRREEELMRQAKGAEAAALRATRVAEAEREAAARKVEAATRRCVRAVEEERARGAKALADEQRRAAVWREELEALRRSTACAPCEQSVKAGCELEQSVKAGCELAVASCEQEAMSGEAERLDEHLREAIAATLSVEPQLAAERRTERRTTATEVDVKVRGAAEAHAVASHRPVDPEAFAELAAVQASSAAEVAALKEAAAAEVAAVKEAAAAEVAAVKEAAAAEVAAVKEAAAAEVRAAQALAKEAADEAAEERRQCEEEVAETLKMMRSMQAELSTTRRHELSTTRSALHSSQEDLSVHRAEMGAQLDAAQVQLSWTEARLSAVVDELGGERSRAEEHCADALATALAMARAQAEAEAREAASAVASAHAEATSAVASAHAEAAAQATAAAALAAALAAAHTEAMRSVLLSEVRAAEEETAQLQGVFVRMAAAGAELRTHALRTEEDLSVHRAEMGAQLDAAQHHALRTEEGARRAVERPARREMQEAQAVARAREHALKAEVEAALPRCEGRGVKAERALLEDEKEALQADKAALQMDLRRTRSIWHAERAELGTSVEDLSAALEERSLTHAALETTLVAEREAHHATRATLGALRAALHEEKRGSLRQQYLASSQRLSEDHAAFSAANGALDMALAEALGEQLAAAESAIKARCRERDALETARTELQAQLTELVGHKNHKQKIQHTMRIKLENDELRNERKQLADDLAAVRLELEKAQSRAEGGLREADKENARSQAALSLG
eukprot:jgi/Chrpa1/20710/Chrysochromulina_OHIO_Genome00008515-RA